MDLSDPALFGANPETGIVAVEFDGDHTALVFRRDALGATRVEEHSFAPFAWTAEPPATLAGPHPLSTLREFPTWKDLAGLRGERAFFFSDPVQQFLTRTGRTLFKGLTFDDLRRLQLHAELDPPADAPHADPTRDRLRLLAVGDATGWERTFAITTDAEERAALVELADLIATRDPDLIEAHHLFRHLLPALAARARHHRLRLTWGRGGLPLTSRSSRLQIAEKTIQYPRYAVPGRHFVDTWVLAQYYDVGTRELEGFDLPDVAAHFGAPADQPLAATRALAATLAATDFVQAQIFPYNFQDVIVRGNATKIDSLFLREYLRCAHSIPEPPEPRPFEGGYTDIFFTGVARNVWHCDITSLYPSLMLSFGLLPASDTLGVFGGLLTRLRAFRYEAKQRMRAAATPAEERHFSAQQNALKILINSFYGYLGFAQGHFADFDAAAAVTARGREILRAMVAWLQQAGARVIEIDTDGIYFQPPADTPADALESGLRTVLPAGIEVEFDARHPAMLSYKAKNYALLTADGGIKLKGAALKSRGMEPYLRDYLLRAIGHILRDEPAAVHALHSDFEAAIRERRWPITQLAKTETLQDSPAAYQRKIAASSRNRSAAFELALASGRDYQAGDTVSYYITGTKKKVVAYEAARPVALWNPAARDENIEYYVAKLHELHAKFAPFAPAGGLPGELAL